MANNPTLDDFATGGETADTVEPIDIVHQWRTEPEPCPRCGEPVQEGWEDGAIDVVCGECKDW